MTKKETITEDIIEIIAHRYMSDWVMDTKHEINLKDVWGFELHWRGDDWHVVVVTRQKTKEDKYCTYELDHWVSISEVRRLLSNPKVIIKGIVNFHFHTSTNFITELQKVLPK